MCKRSRSAALLQRRHPAAWAVKILRGQLPDPAPEERLWLAVIEQAVREAYAGVPGDPARREEAREWLESEYFAEVAVALGLHPQWARETLRKLDGLCGAGARGGALFPCAATPGTSTTGRKSGESLA